MSSAASTSLPRPHRDTLLVYVEPSSGESIKGGIVVLESATEAPLNGYVLAVGEVPGIEVGNNVLFSKYSGTVVPIEGKDYHVLRDADVLMVWPGVFPLPASLNDTPALAIA